MMIERRGVAYDLRGGALGLRPGAGGEEISGVVKKIMIMIYNAVFFFSELKFANEKECREPLRGAEGCLHKHQLNLSMS